MFLSVHSLAHNHTTVSCPVLYCSHPGKNAVDRGALRLPPRERKRRAVNGTGISSPTRKRRRCCTVLYINVTPSLGTVNVCVCIFFPFILDIKFVGRTSRGHTGGRSHRIFHPPSF
ncbi:unnamed protein product, partial [Ascophyllum nodosum]